MLVNLASHFLGHCLFQPSTNTRTAGPYCQFTKTHGIRGLFKMKFKPYCS